MSKTDQSLSTHLAEGRGKYIKRILFISETGVFGIVTPVSGAQIKNPAQDHESSWTQCRKQRERRKDKNTSGNRQSRLSLKGVPFST